MEHKFKGEELTFHENGDITHRTYGKLGANTSELNAWNILIQNFQSSETYPFIELLVREVWDKISTPALCEAVYKVNKGYKRMVIQQLNKPTENDITINEGYNGVYVKVNTSRPFHLSDEHSELKDVIWTLIDAHYEQERLAEEARRVHKEQTEDKILQAVKEVLKDDSSLVLKGEGYLHDHYLVAMFQGKEISGLDLSVKEFTQIVLPELYKELFPSSK